MLAYIVRRLLFIVPTLLGIMVVNFAVIQFAPGGPVEQIIAKLQGTAVGATARIGGGSGGGEIGAGGAPQNAGGGGAAAGRYRGAEGLDPAFIAKLNKMYGFDKPAPVRFLIMMRNYLRFDFGTSYFRDTKVIDLIVEKMPVSISLGLWSTLIIYLISIPLGIRKAVRDGSAFDIWTSVLVIIGYAVPGFLFAVALVVLFAGGSFLHWFPLRGIVSEGWAGLDWSHKLLDYFWHMALPVAALLIGGFANLTQLTKNSFLDEVNKLYVVTARAKGLTERRVLYGHVFRNAMLIVIAGIPGAFIGILFTGALLIEVIFSLDGMGLLGFQAAITRDYPVIFGTLYIFTLIGLLTNLIGDLTYVLVDPRIDFASREV